MSKVGTGDLSQWRIIFGITEGVIVATTFLYLFTLETSIQSFDPQFHATKPVTDKQELIVEPVKMVEEVQEESEESGERNEETVTNFASVKIKQSWSEDGENSNEVFWLQTTMNVKSAIIERVTAEEAYQAFRFTQIKMREQSHARELSDGAFLDDMMSVDLRRSTKTNN